MPTPIKLKRYTGSAYEILQPETTWSQVTDKPSTFTPTAHTHVVADITNNNTLVKTTGNQTIDGVKTFTDTIFINGSINSDGGTIQVNVDSLNVDGGISADGGVDVKGNIRLTGTPTTTNQSRTIEFTGFDKEGTTDFSDNAYIRHTVNSGGLAGSVLEISSQNDADDGINFLTNGANTFRHNGNVIITSNNIGSQSVSNASTATTWQTARTLTIGNTGKSVNGSGNVSWSLAEIGAYAATNPSGYTTYSANQAVNTTSGPTFAEVYNNGWFRNNAANTGLYNQNTTQHWYSTGNGTWKAESTTTTNQIQLATSGNSLRGSIHVDNSNNIGFRNQNNSDIFRLNSLGDVIAGGSRSLGGVAVGVNTDALFTIPSGVKSLEVQMIQDGTTQLNTIQTFFLTTSDIYSLSSSTRSARITWFNGSVAQTMTVSYFLSGTTFRIRHNFNFTVGYRVYCHF